MPAKENVGKQRNRRTADSGLAYRMIEWTGFNTFLWSYRSPITEK